MSWSELHPAWKICIGLSILFFGTVALGSQVLFGQRDSIRGNKETLEEVQAQQKGGEERSYILRAIAGCADLINDQEIEITQECTDSRVAAYYPPSICLKLPIEVDDCGSKAVVVESEK